jgi:hypothetical protein
MNDESPPEPPAASDSDIELASAYLDSALDPADQAQVEGDARLMAVVDQLRAVRAIVGHVDDAPISVREHHLATALEVWDRLPAPVTAPIPLADRRDRRRPRWNTLAAAAAAVVVVGGGIVAVTARSSDDDSSDSLTASESDAPDASTAAGAAPEVAAEQLEVAGIPVTVPAAAAPTGEAARDDEAADLAAEAPPADGGLDVLEDQQDLADFARFALGVEAGPDAETAGTEQAFEGDATGEGPAATSALLPEDTVAPVDDCGFDLIAGAALYGDEPVTVGIDLDRQIAVAFTEDCTEVERVSVR